VWEVDILEFVCEVWTEDAMMAVIRKNHFQNLQEGFDELQLPLQGRAPECPAAAFLAISHQLHSLPQWIHHFLIIWKDKVTHCLISIIFLILFIYL